ncbi:c-type cytochrome [Thalassotalea agariperforans]
MILKYSLSNILALLLTFTLCGVFSANASAIQKGKLAFQKNCNACHSLDKFNTGPSLVYIRDNYPTEKEDAFISWVQSPGKINPDTIQMPPMGHLSKETITEIHNYILTVSQHVKEQQNKPKFPPFKPPAKPFPYVKRGVLPFTNPASIVVSLTPQLSVVWDSYIGKVRYAYPTHANFNGEKKREENKQQILYLENDGSGFSFAQNKPILFKGYELINGAPKFQYQVGDIKVIEQITLGATSNSFKRNFQIKGLADKNKKITLDLSHQTLNNSPSKIFVSKGKLINSTLHLTAKDAANFSIEVRLL